MQVNALLKKQRTGQKLTRRHHQHTAALGGNAIDERLQSGGLHRTVSGDAVIGQHVRFAELFQSRYGGIVKPRVNGCSVGEIFALRHGISLPILFLLKLYGK